MRHLRTVATLPAIAAVLVLAGCGEDPDSGAYTRSSLAGVWGDGAGTVWAVGMDEWRTAILASDGAAWPVKEITFGEQAFDASGRGPDEVYAVVGRDPPEERADAAVLRWDGQVWSLFATGLSTSLTDIWCGPDSALVVAGRGGLVRHREAVVDAVDSTVSRAWVTRSAGTSASLYDLWGAADDDVFAVGRTGVIRHFDGQAWSEQESGTEAALHGVHGRAGDDVFAVGEAGLVLHYDGAAWAPGDTLTGATLLAVWAAPDGTAFAAGRDGTILRHDGAAWSLQREGRDEDLLGLWGRAGDDVWAVGRRLGEVVLDGIVLHWDGAAWTPQETPLARAGAKDPLGP